MLDPRRNPLIPSELTRGSLPNVVPLELDAVGFEALRAHFVRRRWEDSPETRPEGLLDSWVKVELPDLHTAVRRAVKGTGGIVSMVSPPGRKPIRVACRYRGGDALYVSAVLVRAAELHTSSEACPGHGPWWKQTDVLVRASCPDCRAGLDPRKAFEVSIVFGVVAGSRGLVYQYGEADVFGHGDPRWQSLGEDDVPRWSMPRVQ